MRRLTFLLFSLFLGVGLMYAQTKVSGTVISEEDGQPVVGAAVQAVGQATIGTVTDYDGKFHLEVPAGVKLLKFSYVGLQPIELPVKPVMHVKMKATAEALDEVVITAYGSAKKSSLTGSSEVVKADKIDKRVVATVSKALEGTMPGIQTTSGSGQPGAGASVVVRGFGSINSSNNPLYVVDGVPYDGSLNSINPSDIESITVLKDAASGALYGARGANGIVMITTKRGMEEKTQVALKASWGFGSRAIPRYDLMNQNEYIESAFQAYKNDQIFAKGIDPSLAGQAAINAMIGNTTGLFGVDQQYNPFNMPIQELIDPVTGKVNPNAKLRYNENWMDEVERHNPLRQEYQLSVTGGNQNTKYMTSFGYLNEEGLLATTSFERYTGRVSVDSKITDWLKIGTNTSYALNKTNSNEASGSQTSNVWYSAQKMAPIYPVYERDAAGNILYGADGDKLYDYGKNRPAGAQPNFNSVGLLYNDKYYSNSDNLSSRSYIELPFGEKFGFLEGLKLSSNIGFDLVNSRGTVYYNPLFGNAASSGGRLSKSSSRTFSYTWNQLLNYDREWNDHILNVLVGHEFYNYKYNYLSGQKTGFPFKGLHELGPGSTITDANSYENRYAIESWLSRVNYSYANKYYLSASFRTDGSSRFYKDSRWGQFWSVGASWRVSKENFMQDISWIDNLQLRASYGTQGNDNLGTYYAWQSFYSLNWPNAGMNGAMLSSLENKKLKWEKNDNLNVGVDLRIFNMASLTLEYYNRRTKDLLLYVPMATSLGFDGYNDNVGSMTNQGVDITLNLNLIKNRNFAWNLSLMGSVLHNKVNKLAQGRDEIISGNQIIKEGHPINSFYMPKGAGVDPATGAKLYWVWDTDKDGNKSEKYISADPNKATASREIAGSRIPKFQGSINTDFLVFKNFDLSLLATYSIGGKILDGLYNGFMQPMYQGENYHVNAGRAWQNPGDVTDIPRLQLGSDWRTTSDQLIDASYFAIKNITLGYTMPATLLSKIKMNTARVFVTLDNAVIWTHLKGMNPTNNFSGTTDYSYSPVRTVSFGFNVNF